MASHNTGKINWNIIHQNIKWTKETNINIFILLDNNIKPINFLSKQIFNVIEYFSITPEKKSSSNPLIIKHNDKSLNPVDWIGISETANEEAKNYTIYQYLIRGNSLAVEGYIPILLKSYIFFNLVLSDYDNYYMIPFDHWQYARMCDHDLPEFIVNEISNIWRMIRPIICYKRQKNQYKCHCGYEWMIDINSQPIKILTKEDIGDIKNTCALLFKCLYLAYQYCEFDGYLIKNSIVTLFHLNEFYF